jgi:hypothetical protein
VFALIGWIGRFLLIMFVVRMVLRLFTPSAPRSGPMPGGPRPRGPFGARTPQPERVGGQLVRCAQCGTYVPAASAINAPQSGAIVHFCSDKCRQEYAAAHP